MSRETHVEVQRKFDTPADLRIGDLIVVDGVVEVSLPELQQLDGEYFDTATLSLLAAGIGLRRRQGGDDAGWHVKIGRSKGERVEVHEPLGSSRGRPPTSMRDLVLAHTRRTPLERVARIRTNRTLYRLLDKEATSLAEVADDVVTADVPGEPPSTWREVEVELTGGDLAVLDDIERVLTQQGAIPSAASSKLARVLADRLGDEPSTWTLNKRSSAGDVVRRYLHEQTSALVEADPAARVDLEDAVHKMRVATRRLRSALATYRRLLDTDVTEPVRAELKRLGGVLGEVRDAEVIRQHLQGAVDAEPSELVAGPVRDRIERTLDARHQAAHRRLLDELTSTRYLELLAALDHLPDAVGGTLADRPAARVLVAEIRRTHRRMRRRLDAALAAPDADDLLHETRKAAKRVRYAAESATDTLGSKAAKLAARMEEAQETLGTHQDAVVIRTVLRDLAGDADRDGEPSFTYGRLHAQEQQRGDQAEAAFIDLVEDHWARRPRWMH